ncbi:hypothetical protein Fmac_004746 [Flemingia macrophylla]|uniref:Uncharacterized protein n=1 Tax=Flemingia macrophylla TaxID=520843 RepID=A0ABD1N5V2_9FABA
MSVECIPFLFLSCVSLYSLYRLTRQVEKVRRINEERRIKEKTSAVEEECSEAIEKNISIRVKVFVPKTTFNKHKHYSVVPLLLGFFLLFLIGAFLFHIIKSGGIRHSLIEFGFGLPCSRL